MENTAAVSPGQEELFQQLRKRILQAARRWLPPGEAEDVAHNTILVLINRYMDKPDQELPFIANRVLSYKLLEWWKQHQPFVSPDDPEETANVDERKPWQRSGAGPKYTNPEEEKTARGLDLEKLLAALPSDGRKIIQMRREGWNNEEIAQELGLPTANAVAARVHFYMQQISATISANEPGAPNKPTGRIDL